MLAAADAEEVDNDDHSAATAIKRRRVAKRRHLLSAYDLTRV